MTKTLLEELILGDLRLAAYDDELKG